MSYLQAPERPIALRQPVSPSTEPDQPEDTIAVLIQRATASDVPRLVKAADKIQDLVDQLEKDVAEHELGAELRAEAARLEARLAEIRGQIGGKRTAQPAARPSHDAKAVREWAAAQGLQCPARGRIPRVVLDAFEGADR